MLDRVDDLFNDIESSDEYKEYKKIGNILDKDPNIYILMQEIKELQREAVYLESNNDLRYEEVYKIISNKVDSLTKNEIYKEYLDKMKKFNEKILKN